MSQLSAIQPFQGQFLLSSPRLRVKSDPEPFIGSTLSGEFLDKTPSNINLDARYLFNLCIKISPQAMRVYMALLTRLIRNNDPISWTIKDLKLQLGYSKQNCTVQQSLRELERERAIIRNKGDYTTFYINPLFAWTGDRMQYFDPSTLPLLPEED